MSLTLVMKGLLVLTPDLVQLPMVQVPLILDSRWLVQGLLALTPGPRGLLVLVLDPRRPVKRLLARILGPRRLAKGLLKMWWLARIPRPRWLVQGLLVLPPRPRRLV
jgi:hypothetical protein